MAQFQKMACKNKETLNKSTFVALLAEGSPMQNFFSQMADEDWLITGFNAHTREVCIQLIHAPRPPRHITITFPWFAAKF